LGIGGSIGNVQLDAGFCRTTSFFGNRIGIKTTMAFVAGGENWARCGWSPMAGQSSQLRKQDAVFEGTISAQWALFTFVRVSLVVLGSSANASCTGRGSICLASGSFSAAQGALT